jgi:uncharacterized protein (TIGR03067 family)
MSVCPCLALALVLAPAAADDPPKRPRELAAAWVLTRSETDGQVSTPEAGAPKSRLTFPAPDKCLFQAGDVRLEFTVKVDAAAKPALVDVTLGGPDNPQTLEGIWKVEGDTLPVCLSPPQKKERPTEFAAGAGSGRLLFTFQRDKE